MPKIVDWKALIGKIYTNKNNEDAVVINAIDNTHIELEFLDTKHKLVTRMDKLRNGAFQNPVHKSSKPTGQVNMIGKILTTRSGQKIKVLDQRIRKQQKELLVVFEETFTTKWGLSSNIISGKIRDDYAITVCGIGYRGKPDTSLHYDHQARTTWNHMMQRCYGLTYDNTAKVCKRWHCYENFLSDISKVEGFKDWLIEPMDLDKDKKGRKSRVYSLETCIFLLKEENISIGAGRK